MTTASDTTEDKENPPTGVLGRMGLRDLIQGMTMHGFSHTADRDRTMWNRILWLLLSMAALGAFTYFLYELIIDFKRYPYKELSSTTAVVALPFPAITLCNLNSFDILHIAKDSEAEALQGIMRRQAFGRDLDLAHFSEAELRYLNKSAQSILEETNPGAEGFIKSCFYNGVQLNCSEVFYASYWALHRCFTLKTTSLINADASTTLRVILYIHEDGYIFQEEKSLGVNFFVHEAGSLFDIYGGSMMAAPGFSTRVGFRHKESSLLEYPYKTYRDSYCLTPSSIREAYPSFGDQPYHLMNCLRQRAIRQASETCNCTLPFQPEDPDQPPCRLYDILACVNDELDELRKNVLLTTEELDCPRPCNYVDYDSDLSFSRYPSYVSKQSLVQTGLLEADNVSHNYLEMMFYYAEMMKTETYIKPEYTPLSVMGTLGGNLGFFLGASVLSVCEIVEFLVLLIPMLIRKVVTYWNGGRVIPDRQRT